MTLQVYLDTSVLSAIDDLRYPERARLTRVFWDRRAEFEVCTSETARQEVDRTPDTVRRSQILPLLAQMTVYPITTEMESLARQYVDAEVFGESMINDALHVAAAVHLGCNILLSWNFKHLVNRHRRAAIATVNVAANLPTIEIIAPPEL